MVALVFVMSGSVALIGNQNAGTLSAFTVKPGQAADSIGWLVNRTGQTVTLESATVLPLKGFRTPRLLGVAVERWNPKSHGFRDAPTAGAGRGWPPSGLTRTVALTHYRLESGGGLRHHTALIVFGVVSRSAGRFAAAGVTVTVRIGDRLVQAKSIGPLLFCVTTKQYDVSCSDRGQQQALRASKAFE